MTAVVAQGFSREFGLTCSCGGARTGALASGGIGALEDFNDRVAEAEGQPVSGKPDYAVTWQRTMRSVRMNDRLSLPWIFQVSRCGPDRGRLCPVARARGAGFDTLPRQVVA